MLLTGHIKKIKPIAYIETNFIPFRTWGGGCSVTKQPTITGDSIRTQGWRFAEQHSNHCAMRMSVVELSATDLYRSLDSTTTLFYRVLC